MYQKGCIEVKNNKTMSKVVPAILVVGMMLSMVTGCAKDQADPNATGTTATTPTVAGDANALSVMELEDVSRYIQVADYKNMPINLQKSYTIDASMGNQYADYYLSQAASSVSKDVLVTDRAVEEGDTAHIDYIGYKDGEPFDGGNTQGNGAALKIGSHSYIEGFEEGLVGVMPGETVDLNLTFPAVYQSAELAGAEVVFTVTVNGIIPEEEIIKAWNTSNGADAADYDGVSKYYLDKLEANSKNQYAQDVDEMIAQTLLDTAVVVEEFPGSLILAYQQSASDALNMYAQNYGMDAESIAQYMIGMTAEQYIVQSSYEQLKLAAICRYIAEQENLIPDDNTIYSRATAYLIDLGYSDPAIVLADANMDDFKMQFIQDDVLEMLRSTCTVTTLD